MALPTPAKLRTVQRQLCCLYPVYDQARENPLLREHVNMRELKLKIEDLLAQQRVLQTNFSMDRADVIVLDGDEEEQVIVKKEKRPRVGRRISEPEVDMELNFATFLASKDGHVHSKTGRRTPNYHKFAMLNPLRNNSGWRNYYRNSRFRKARIDRLVQELKDASARLADR